MNRMATDAYLVLKSRFDQATAVGRERGLTTTEIAVLTFVLVAMAVAVGGLLWTYASDQVNALPDDPTAGIGGTGTN